MASEYRQIYSKDLIPIIEDMAIEIMMTPSFSGLKADKTDMTLAEISAHNSLVAMHNEGIREMALMLKHRLLKGDDPDDA